MQKARKEQTYSQLAGGLFDPTRKGYTAFAFSLLPPVVSWVVFLLSERSNR